MGSYASTARVQGTLWRAGLGTVQDNAHRGEHTASSPVSGGLRTGGDRIPVAEGVEALPQGPRRFGLSGMLSRRDPSQSHDATFTTDPESGEYEDTGSWVDHDALDQIVLAQDVGGYSDGHDVPQTIRAGAAGRSHEIRPQLPMRIAYTRRRFPRSEQYSDTARQVRTLGAAVPNRLQDVTDGSRPGGFVTSGSGFRQNLRSDLLTIRRTLRPWDEQNVVPTALNPEDAYVDHSAEHSTAARLRGWRTTG